MVRALEDDFRKVVGIRQVMSDIAHQADLHKLIQCSKQSALTNGYDSFDSPHGFLGCSWYLWVFVVFFLMLNVDGMILLHQHIK